MADLLGGDSNLAKSKVQRFADGETYVEITEPSVFGKDIYIVQSTSKPVNDNIMELVLTTTSCKRAGARSVTGIIPYYGYSRMERKTVHRPQPLSAQDVG